MLLLTVPLILEAFFKKIRNTKLARDVSSSSFFALIALFKRADSDIPRSYTSLDHFLLTIALWIFWISLRPRLILVVEGTSVPEFED